MLHSFVLTDTKAFNYHLSAERKPEMNFVNINTNSIVYTETVLICYFFQQNVWSNVWLMRFPSFDHRGDNYSSAETESSQAIIILRIQYVLSIGLIRTSLSQKSRSPRAFDVRRLLIRQCLLAWEQNSSFSQILFHVSCSTFKLVAHAMWWRSRFGSHSLYAWID